MKTKTLLFASAAALALMTLAAGNLQAQMAMVTNVVSISFTAAEQNTTNDNGTITTIAAPAIHSATTKTILGWLAIDENEEGNYTAGTAFPPGAKLVVISTSENSPDFQVLDKHNDFLVDVSDILSVTNTGVYGSDISSGKTSDSTTLADPTETDQQVYSLIYDDSASTGDEQFAFSGVIKNVTTDSKPNTATGVYKETQSYTISAGQGDGVYEGNPFVVTGGSFKASGSGPGIILLP